LTELIAEVLTYLERAQRPDFKIRTRLGFRFVLVFGRTAIHDGQSREVLFSAQLDG